MSKAWMGQYALDGFFQFGAPLNANRYVVDPTDHNFGFSTDTTWVARFLLDEEIAVIERLRSLMHGGITNYPMLTLMRRSTANVGPPWLMENRFHNAWMSYLGPDWHDASGPLLTLGGQVLEISCNKADNPQIVPTE